ncbi:MAG: hypothetical protein AAB839_01230 [Patescibacteria group bacterium]
MPPPPLPREPLTIDKAEELGILQRLKLPLWPFAHILDWERTTPAGRPDTMLSRWLEGLAWVEAWQFIELTPAELRARCDNCGPKKIAALNDLLRVLQLPALGTPFASKLVRFHLNWHGGTIDTPEAALRRSMERTRAAWDTMPRRLTGQLDYREHSREHNAMQQLARQYLEKIVGAQGYC